MAKEDIKQRIAGPENGSKGTVTTVANQVTASRNVKRRKEKKVTTTNRQIQLRKM